jgi:Raf kinase inhibitor-like YbhB/YbcL family protein
VKKKAFLRKSIIKLKDILTMIAEKATFSLLSGSRAYELGGTYKHHGGNTMQKLTNLFILLFSLMSALVYAEPSSHMTLNASGIGNQKTIPTEYTCDGANISPELNWSSTVPAKTDSLVLVLSDPDAPGGTFYHWIVYNIPLSVHSLSKGIKKLPQGAKVVKNSMGKMQYNGPCPPIGETHRYIFSLYGVDNKLNLPEDADGKSVLDAISNHVIGAVDLSGNYKRNK